MCDANAALNTMNNIVNDALKRAMAAIHHLNDQGTTVTEVSIRGGRPIIQIDAPGSRFLQGSIKTRRREGDTHRVCLVAPVHGCQVEWTEVYPIAGEARA